MQDRNLVIMWFWYHLDSGPEHYLAFSLRLKDWAVPQSKPQMELDFKLHPQIKLDLNSSAGILALGWAPNNFNKRHRFCNGLTVIHRIFWDLSNWYHLSCNRHIITHDLPLSIISSFSTRPISPEAWTIALTMSVWDELLDKSVQSSFFKQRKLLFSW